MKFFVLLCFLPLVFTFNRRLTSTQPTIVTEEIKEPFCDLCDIYHREPGTICPKSLDECGACLFEYAENEDTKVCELQPYFEYNEHMENLQNTCAEDTAELLSRCFAPSQHECTLVPFGIPLIDKTQTLELIKKTEKWTASHVKTVLRYLFDQQTVILKHDNEIMKVLRS